MSDPVNHPAHYTSHPSGVECLTVTRHMNFNLGNALKYIWRADQKGAAIQDLQKAAFYIADEIKRRNGDEQPKPHRPISEQFERMKANNAPLNQGVGHG